MKKPYAFHFDSAPQQVSNTFPDWAEYPFAAAQGLSSVIFESAAFVSQQLDFSPFYIELFELNASKAFGFTYEITQPQYFLFFMLKGQAGFTTSQGFFVSHVAEGHFGVSYNGPGHYRLKVQPGIHTALCVAIDPAWVRFAFSGLPNLKAGITGIEINQEDYQAFPYCLMDQRIHRWLKSVYAEIIKNVGTLDGTLRFCMAKILERYDYLMIEKKRSLPYLVRAYIDQCYTQPGLNYKSLSLKYETTQRKLTYCFQKEFHVSIHRYCTALRMRQASYLIERQGRLISDVYQQVGYNDESTFRYMYNQFFHR